MELIGIRDLKAHASRIVAKVRDERQPVGITYHGRIVARIVPVDAPTTDDAAVWAEIDQLAAEISARWPAGVTAAEAVDEGRRRL